MNLTKTKELKQLKLFTRRRLAMPIQVGEPSQLDIVNHKKLLEGFGFTVSKETSAFFHVTFPKGWKFQIMANSSAWAYLYDELKRQRGAVFYRFIRYFRDVATGKKMMEVSSHVNYNPRIRVMIDHRIPFSIIGKNKNNHFESPMYGKIICYNDNQKHEVLFETEEIEMKSEYKFADLNYDAEEKRNREKLFNICEKTMLEKFPEAQNITSYWDWDIEEIKQKI